MEQIFDSGLQVLLRRATATRRRQGTLLWVHGLGESGLCFEDLLHSSRLQDWDRLALDLPGYGKSPWPSVPLSLTEHAELLARFIGERLPEPPIVIGHSMGGVIGQILAEIAPQQLRALCNVEGNLSAGDCTFSGRAAAMDLRQFAAHGFSRLRREVFTGGSDDLALRTYFASLCLADPTTFHRNSIELVEISAAEELAHRLAELTLPRIYVLGSPGGGPQRSRDLLEQAGIPPLVVSPAGHWPFLDRPADFLDAVLPFFRG